MRKFGLEEADSGKVNSFRHSRRQQVGVLNTYPFRSYFLNTGKASRGSPSCGGKDKSSSTNTRVALPGRGMVCSPTLGGLAPGPGAALRRRSPCLSLEITRSEVLVRRSKSFKSASFHKVKRDSTSLMLILACRSPDSKERGHFIFFFFFK